MRINAMQVSGGRRDNEWFRRDNEWFRRAGAVRRDNEWH